jgi:hypothetical protein
VDVLLDEILQLHKSSDNLHPQFISDYLLKLTNQITYQEHTYPGPCCYFPHSTPCMDGYIQFILPAT